MDTFSWKIQPFKTDTKQKQRICKPTIYLKNCIAYKSHSNKKTQGSYSKIHQTFKEEIT